MRDSKLAEWIRGLRVKDISKVISSSHASHTIRGLRYHGKFRACSHGGGVPQVGEVPHLPEVRKTWPSHVTPGCWGEVVWSLSTYVNKYGGWQTLCGRKRDSPFVVIFSGSFPVMRVNFDLFNPRETSNPVNGPRCSKSI